jgi:hypothetical protein
MTNLLRLPLAGVLVLSLVACGDDDTDTPAGDVPVIPQQDGVDARTGEIESADNGAAFCEAWNNLHQADDPPSDQHLRAVLDTAPPALSDAVAMYVGVVEEYGSTAGIVSAMDFEQEMQLFSITDWYVQNCVGE